MRPEVRRLFSTPPLRDLFAIREWIALGGLMIGVMGLLLCCAAAGFGWWQHRILTTWVDSEAQVEGARVTVSVSGGQDGASVSYGASIQFRYRAAGVEYVSESRSSNGSGSREDMERVVAAFQPGTRCTIKYNPGDPREIRHDAGYTYDFFALPLIMGGAGLGMLAFGFLVHRASGVARRRPCPGCGYQVRRGHRYCPQCGTPLPIE